MELAMTWTLFDILGTIAFAVSGAMVGLARRMDIFGVTVLASLTAVGGGIVRDMLAGRTPPMAFRDSTDTFLAIGTALAVTLLYEAVPLTHRGKARIGVLFHVSDTLGLAAFTVTGTMTGFAVQAEDAYLLPVTLGVLTAVGGGILRDVLAQRIPSVLHTDVYAVAAVVGAAAICAAWFDRRYDAAPWIGFAAVTLLRACALHFGWQLYKPRAYRFNRTLRRWRDDRRRKADEERR